MSQLNSMGFAKPPAATRIVVAMSGGVDSSVAAALLARDGYDVVGLTMQLYDVGAATAKSKTCCAGQDIYDARRVADRIGMPHYVLDYETTFKTDVIDRFADSYVRGETPVPCIMCNQTVKFRDLFKAAQDLGADALATGHYVQRLMGVQGPELHRAVDPSRDQSYFLFATTQPQLDYLRFPLGTLTKAETRAIAAELDLAVADKPDSQDICFVPDGDYAALIRKLRPEGVEPGEIVDLEGRVLGQHEGIVHYTIGQRRGLGIAGAEPLYVAKIDAKARRVIVGPREALRQEDIRVTDLNWLGAPLTAEPAPVFAKIRSARPPVPADIRQDAQGPVVTIRGGEYGVSPGQACVLYAGEGPGQLVLGGGFIART